MIKSCPQKFSISHRSFQGNDEFKKIIQFEMKKDENLNEITGITCVKTMDFIKQDNSPSNQFLRTVNDEQKQLISTNPIIARFQSYNLAAYVIEFPPLYSELLSHTQNKFLQEFENYQYCGQFQKSKPHGRGMKINLSNGRYYDGLFEDGNFIWGIAIEQNTADETCRYIGPYVNNKKHGEGIMEWWIEEVKGSGFFTKTEVYEGQFNQGVIQGFGIRKYTNYHQYEGQWENNKKNGKGIMYFNIENEKYEGEFKNGVFHGEGVYYHSDGLQEKGNYHEGKSVGKHHVYKNDKYLKTISYLDQ